MMKEKRNVFNAQMKLKINEQSIKFHYDLQPTNGKKTLLYCQFTRFIPFCVRRDLRVESNILSLQ